jgi:hypothetical protein
VSIVFLSQKDKISRNDTIVNKTIEIDKEIGTLTEQIRALLKLYIIIITKLGKDPDGYYTKDELLTFCNDINIVDPFDAMEIKQNLSLFDGASSISAKDVAEKIRQHTRTFWQKLKEIGFLDSYSNSIHKEIIEYTFKDVFYRTCIKKGELTQNFLELVYMFVLCDMDCNKFAKELTELKCTTKKYPPNITFNDFDLKTLGKFTKKTYPLIWKFVWEGYEVNVFKKYVIQSGKWIWSIIWTRLRKIIKGVMEPLLIATIFYIFAKVITKWNI